MIMCVAVKPGWVTAVGPSATTDTEVDDAPATVVAAHDVRGFDVAVDEPSGVGGTQRARHLTRDTLDLRHWHRTAHHLVGQAGPGSNSMTR